LTSQLGTVSTAMKTDVWKIRKEWGFRTPQRHNRCIQ